MRCAGGGGRRFPRRRAGARKATRRGRRGHSALTQRRACARLARRRDTRSRRRRRRSHLSRCVRGIRGGGSPRCRSARAPNRNTGSPIRSSIAPIFSRYSRRRCARMATSICSSARNSSSSAFTQTASRRWRRRATRSYDTRGSALIAADGVRSTVRDLMPGGSPVVHSGRTAWRAAIKADDAPIGLPRDCIGLWIGPDAHLVHYPIRGGETINVVAIVKDTWDSRRLERARRPRMDRGAVPPLVSGRACDSRRRTALAQVAAAHRQSFRHMGCGTSCAARRRGARDDAVPRAGWRDGDRRCGGAGAIARCVTGRAGGGALGVREPRASRACVACGARQRRRAISIICAASAA